MSDRPPQLADFGLTEARYQELSRAFSGAHSLLFLCVLLGMTFGFYLPIADKVQGWLLMLFVSGLLRMLLAIVFKRLVPDYLAVMRYDHARRRQGRE
jgi:hypothetical protein